MENKKTSTGSPNPSMFECAEIIQFIDKVISYEDSHRAKLANDIGISNTSSMVPFRESIKNDLTTYLDRAVNDSDVRDWFTAYGLKIALSRFISEKVMNQNICRSGIGSEVYKLWSLGYGQKTIREFNIRNSQPPMPTLGCGFGQPPMTPMFGGGGFMGMGMMGMGGFGQGLSPNNFQQSHFLPDSSVLYVSRIINALKNAGSVETYAVITSTQNPCLDFEKIVENLIMNVQLEIEIVRHLIDYLGVGHNEVIKELFFEEFGEEYRAYPETNYWDYDGDVLNVYTAHVSNGPGFKIIERFLRSKDGWELLVKLLGEYMSSLGYSVDELTLETTVKRADVLSFNIYKDGRISQGVKLLVGDTIFPKGGIFLVSRAVRPDLVPTEDVEAPVRIVKPEDKPQKVINTKTGEEGILEGGTMQLDPERVPVNDFPTKCKNLSNLNTKILTYTGNAKPGTVRSSIRRFFKDIGYSVRIYSDSSDKFLIKFMASSDGEHYTKYKIGIGQKIVYKDGAISIEN